MAATCAHLDTITDVTPPSNGCEDCLRIGGRWVHLRLCMHRPRTPGLRSVPRVRGPGVKPAGWAAAPCGAGTSMTPARTGLAR